MIDGEIIKNGDRYECITSKTTLSQMSFNCFTSIFIPWYKSILNYGFKTSYRKLNFWFYELRIKITLILYLCKYTNNLH